MAEYMGSEEGKKRSGNQLKLPEFQECFKRPRGDEKKDLRRVSSVIEGLPSLKGVYSRGEGGSGASLRACFADLVRRVAARS